MTNNWILGILPPQMYTIVYENYIQDILIRLLELTKSWHLQCTLTAVPINLGIIVHWDVTQHWERTTAVCLSGFFFFFFFSWRIITLYAVHGVLQAIILQSFSPPVDHICQNSSLWSIHLGWPWTAWLTASLSHANPFSMMRWLYTWTSSDGNTIHLLNH